MIRTGCKAWKSCPSSSVARNSWRTREIVFSLYASVKQPDNLTFYLHETENASERPQLSCGSLSVVFSVWTKMFSIALRDKAFGDITRDFEELFSFR